jgi:hypothetical protein
VRHLDAQTVTTGGVGTAGSQDRYRGFSTTNGIGSIVDGTSDIYSGASITELYWFENFGTPYYYLAITGATDTGWTTMSVDGTLLARTSATYSSGTWTWSAPGSTVGSQAFGSIGATVSAVFT